MAVQSRKSPYRGKIRERLAVLAYVTAHGVAPAPQRFGLDRKTVRTWHPKQDVKSRRASQVLPSTLS